MELTDTSLNTSMLHCFHCGLPVSALGKFTSTINGVERDFCCTGCQHVCEIIHDKGMGQFYKFAPGGRNWDKPSKEIEDAEVFDSLQLQQDFVFKLENGDYTATLLIDKLHCPACVWLIEHVVKSLDGVKRCEVNYTRQSLNLDWNPEKVQLSSIIKAIGDVGYRALPFEEDQYRIQQKKQRQDILFRMVFAGFIWVNVMTAAICLYAGGFFGIEKEWESLFKWYSLIFTTGAIWYSARIIFINAWRVIKNFRLNMDVPISLGIAVSFIYSCWATVKGEQHVYFDSISMFIFLILIGRFLESSARETATSLSQKLLTLIPYAAHRIDEQGQEIAIPVRAVTINDILRVRPGEKIPVDGVIVNGSTKVNEALISGESQAKKRTIGENVIGGSINVSGTIDIKAEKIGKQSTIVNIINMIQNAQNSKVAVQNIADRIVPYFVASILGLALLTFLFWFWQGPLSTAVVYAITVLIITCPCALGLAAPMATAIASGVAAKFGILFRDGASIEQLSKIDHVVFDKTGTLTQGNFNVIHHNCYQLNINEFWQVVAAMENHANHPIALAIVDHVRAMKQDIRNLPSVNNFENIPGLGIRGEITVGGKSSMVNIGSLNWFRDNGGNLTPEQHTSIEHEYTEQRTVIGIFTGQTLLGWISLGDKIRDDVQPLINWLQKNNINISIISGDSTEAVNAVADHLSRQLKISNRIERCAEMLPGDKIEKVRDLQKQGLRVAMLGDGINDAPALSQANVGIAVAQSTDITSHVADIELLGGLDKFRIAIILSRITTRVILQNIMFSIGYNLFAIPLAMAGLIVPLLAAILMPISSLIVVANALRIKRKAQKLSESTTAGNEDGYYFNANTSGVNG